MEIEKQKFVIHNQNYISESKHAYYVEISVKFNANFPRTPQLIIYDNGKVLIPKSLQDMGVDVAVLTKFIIEERNNYYN